MYIGKMDKTFEKNIFVSKINASEYVVLNWLY